MHCILQVTHPAQAKNAELNQPNCLLEKWKVVLVMPTGRYSYQTALHTSSTSSCCSWTYGHFCKAVFALIFRYFFAAPFSRCLMLSENFSVSSCTVIHSQIICLCKLLTVKPSRFAWLATFLYWSASKFGFPAFSVLANLASKNSDRSRRKPIWILNFVPQIFIIWIAGRN